MKHPSVAEVQRFLASGWPGERVVADGPKQNPTAKGYPPVATATVVSSNAKTGPTFATWVAQSSCPHKGNNKAGYQCPLLGTACYAEHGQAGWTTSKLNKAAGVDPKRGVYAGDMTPEEIAEVEAASIIAAIPAWKRAREKPFDPNKKSNSGSAIIYGKHDRPMPNPFARLHVVGDCVTPVAAKIVSHAAEKLVMPIPGATPDTCNVWTYTHAWRSVPRSAWSSKISVLASLDCFHKTPEQLAREMEQAHRQGYAIALVVPDYAQAEGLRYGASYTLKNGFKIIPCPYEVRRRVKDDKIELSVVDPGKESERERRTGRQLQCVDCQLCLKDKFLHRNKAVIAFAVHGDPPVVAEARKVMVDPLKLEPVSTFGDGGQLPVLSNIYDMHANDRDYTDVLERLDRMAERGDFRKGARAKKSNPASPEAREIERKTRIISDYLAKAQRNRYFDSIAEINELLDRAAAAAGLRMTDYVTTAVPYERSVSLLLATSHPEIFVHVTIYRMHTGRYELVSYPTRQSRARRGFQRKGNPYGDMEHSISQSILDLLERSARPGEQEVLSIGPGRKLHYLLGEQRSSDEPPKVWIWTTEVDPQTGEENQTSDPLQFGAADRQRRADAIHYALHHGTLAGYLGAGGDYPSEGVYAEEWHERKENPEQGEDVEREEVVEMGSEAEVPDFSETYEQAEGVYEMFHGAESDEEVVVEEGYAFRENLAALGTLEELQILSPSKVKFEIRFEDDDKPLLCSSADGQQMYIVGGDQSIADGNLLEILDGDEEAVNKDKVLLGAVQKLVYRTEKDFDEFETIDYEHELGEEGGFEPVAVYDRVNAHIELVGGSYKIKREGIVN